jgi:Hint domain-containing protein
MPPLFSPGDADVAFAGPGTAADDLQVACFAAGTWIAARRGHVSVETVHPGMWVCTLLRGDQAEVVWTGRRVVDCTRHPEPTMVWPVRVSADAFGRGMPATELYLSPNHAVFVERVLIPIRLLVNGRSVRQVMTERISYHHIELAQHDVLLANGLPAESYLDTGDKARFSNGGDVITLHPDFSARSQEARGCAPLVETGRKLADARNRLAAGGARRGRRPRQSVASGEVWSDQYPDQYPDHDRDQYPDRYPDLYRDQYRDPSDPWSG